MSRKIIVADKAPSAIGPYSQAVWAGKTLFLSGQIPIDPTTGELVEGGIEQQVSQVLKNVKAVLESAGLGMEDIVKTTVFLVDLVNFPFINKAYSEFFSEPFPARSTIQISALPKGAMVEIEAIAYKDENKDIM